MFLSVTYLLPHPLHFIVAVSTVFFPQTNYIVEESQSTLIVLLMVDSPQSAQVDVQVTSQDENAIGM